MTYVVVEDDARNCKLVAFEGVTVHAEHYTTQEHLSDCFSPGEYVFLVTSDGLAWEHKPWHCDELGYPIFDLLPDA